MQHCHSHFALLGILLALGACVPPGASNDGPGASSAAASGEKEAAHRRASADATPAVAAPSVEKPNYAIGDSCTYERTVNNRKSTEKRVVSEIANGRLIWASSMDDGRTAKLEFDAASMDVYRDVALANNQSITFSSPYRWVDYPLTAGKAWETQAIVNGESFTADVKTKVIVGKWEKLKVPAGEFDAIKVTWKERINSNGSHGSGTLSYWMSPSSKCMLKAIYSNSWGEKGQTLLVASGQ